MRLPARHLLTLAILLLPAVLFLGLAKDRSPAPTAPPAQTGEATKAGEGGQTAAKPKAPMSEAERREALFRHRNLGKAFYENPATQDRAVDELRAALALAPNSPREHINLGLALLKAGKTDEGIAELKEAQKLDPSVPHTWFNLGIAYKREGKIPEAITQLEGMVQRVPDEPKTRYNLGVLYKLAGRDADALHELERAAELDSRFAAPHYQLAAAYRQAGRTDDAKREMESFREAKAAQADAAVPEDPEWSWYSELWDPVEPEPAAAGPAPELRFERSVVAAGDDRLDPATARLVVLDADGDGRPDLLALSARGVSLWKDGHERVASGLEGVTGVVAAAAGDLDDDGLADLCLLTAKGARLYRNTGGRFAPLPVPLPARPFTAAVWLDVDHDYDLDLVLLGREPALLRNVTPADQAGPPAFEEKTGEIPLPPAGTDAELPAAAVPFDLVADSQAEDLAVARAGEPGILLRDLLGGRWEARKLAALPAGTTALAATDANHDGWTDLLVAGASGVTLLVNDHHEGAEARPLPGKAPVVAADLENRGATDLVTGAGVLRDRGLGRYDPPATPAGFGHPVALAAADFDGDGRVDLAAVDAGGELALLANRTETGHRHLAIALAGVKNPKLAAGSEVEVKAGSLYQKKLYRGVPLLFGLGAHEAADTVRITWPNGLIQNETDQAAELTGKAMNAGTAVAGEEAGLHLYKEAPRLSGSCPMIYTWNGHELEFITDVLGVAPLGASSGDGSYFPVDHDEDVWIAGHRLAPRNGHYNLRIAEELREVAYLDQVHLAAVDHPADVDIFTNDKFKGPPFPEFRLFGVRRRIYPQAARDGEGHDVLARLLHRDRTYPDGFRRDSAGIAERHTLTLDFGPAAARDGRAILVLSGWVDWADGSTFLAAAQGGREGLVLPYLQVRDADGRWVTAIDDMGIPAGKPKTIVVDLTGKFRSASREVRIVTNLCVYWDEIFLAEDPSPPEVTLTEVPPAAADLHFRGFSRVVIDPQRKQPERFVYADVRPFAMWNPTPGLYTRYGDVTELLGKVDDRLVVMGSGDEIALSYDAGALPPLAPGWRRDFLLRVDGWAKDGDANTAYSQTVEPLPYHGMPQYPYAAPDHYPDDAVHRRYREEYLTRPALRLIRPLTEGLPVAAGRR